MTGSLQRLMILPIVCLAYHADGNAQKFYPVETGNAWHYHISYNRFPQPTDSANLQVTIQGDSLMPNGHRYKSLSAPDILGARFVRVDFQYVYYYSPGSGADVPMYNLHASPGTVDSVHWQQAAGLLVSSAMVSVSSQSVFGVERTVRRYLFDGIVRYEIALANGLGVVEAFDMADGVWPYYAKWDIRGALIQDTLYGTLVGVAETGAPPQQMVLHQNYPNPFNPHTFIEFEISFPGPVRLILTDLSGREVADLVNGHTGSGKHRVSLSGSGLATGVYFYRLHGPTGVISKRMIHLK